MSTLGDALDSLDTQFLENKQQTHHWH
jgi:hypothetical protein